MKIFTCWVLSVSRLVRQGETGDSIFVDRGVVQRSERQDDDASAGHARWCYKGKVCDEAKWKAQDALKRHLRDGSKREPIRCSAGLMTSGRFRSSYHIGRCAQDANVQDEQVVRSIQESCHG